MTNQIASLVQQIDELLGVFLNTDSALALLPQPPQRAPSLPCGLSLRVLFDKVQREALRRCHVLEARLSLEEPESLEDVLALLMLGRDRLDDLSDTECEDSVIADRCLAAAVRGLRKHTAGHPIKNGWCTARNRSWPEVAAESEQEASAILGPAGRRRSLREQPQQEGSSAHLASTDKRC